MNHNTVQEQTLSQTLPASTASLPSLPRRAVPLKDSCATSRGSPHPLSSYHTTHHTYTSVVYTHPDLFSGFSFQGFLFWSEFFNLNGASCESSMLHSAHYPQGQRRDGTWHTEEGKPCTKKSPYWKEAVETKWLNYVPVGGCSR